MATIDDARAQLLAGQAARLRDEAGKADELLRRGSSSPAISFMLAPLHMSSSS